MSRGRTVAVCLVLAGGLGFGAGQFGQLAFGHHDDAPENVALETAAAQPENKWATVHGRIDANTLVKVAHPLGHDQVAFRLLGAGPDLIVLTNTTRHPRLAETLDEEQTFTGVITKPGSGMNKENTVELDDDRFKVTGLIGSYCSHVTGCPAKPKVLLVGETPRGRATMFAATIALGLLALLCLAVAFKRPTT